MKIILQRVETAHVTVEGEITGAINQGYLVYLGVGDGDTRAAVEKAVDKIVNLRLFADAQGKTNLSLADVGGALLVVSQFTLYADCRKGNRPSFTDAGSPQLAEELYEYFIAYAKTKSIKVESGVFAADMKVSSINDGPFTVIIDHF